MPRPVTNNRSEFQNVHLKRKAVGVNPAHVQTGETTEYFVVDPDCRELAGKRIFREEGKSPTISLTEHAALHFLASGAISTSDPLKDDSAREAVAAHPEGDKVGDELPPAGKAKHHKPHAHA